MTIAVLFSLYMANVTISNQNRMILNILLRRLGGSSNWWILYCTVKGMQAESDPSIFQPQWTLHRSIALHCTKAYTFTGIYLLKIKKRVFPDFAGLLCLQKKIYSLPARRWKSRHGTNYRYNPVLATSPPDFFLDSNMPKMPDLAYYAFISPSAWPIPLKNSCIAFSAKFATKKLKPPKRYDHFLKIQGSLRGHTFQNQNIPKSGKLELRQVNAS